jgi:hypothetical protein
MNWINSAIVSIVATVLSLFGVHQTQLPPVTSINNQAQQIIASSSSVESSSATGVPVGWQTYKNEHDWGFQISYPSNLRFVSDDENLNGPRHYLIPQEPYAQSGYAGKILEIADVQGTSSIKSFLQVTMLPVLPKSLAALDENVQAIVASSTILFSNIGSATFRHFTIDSQNMPAIVYASSTNPNKQVTYIYYYRPPFDIFGKPQSARLLRIEFAPNDNSLLQQIAGTMKDIPIIPTDAALIDSAQSEKNTFWCEHVQDSLMKKQCYIVVRGHPIFDYYPVSLDTVAAKNGAVKFVGTSTVVLSATKASGDKTGVAWVSLVVTPTTPWDMIDIEPVFTNGKESEGLLTVLWDTQTIGQDDGRLGDMSAVGGYGAMYIGTSTYASHVLGLRFDTFGTSTGSVKISNMKAEVIH